MGNVSTKWRKMGTRKLRGVRRNTDKKICNKKKR
jgi:hypothetical protein